MNLSFFLLLFCLSPLFAFSQNQSTKTLLIVSPYTDSNCKYVAFKVSDSKIEIDACYNVDSKEFKCTKSIPLSTERLLEDLFNMPITKLKQHEKAINATKCDYGFPIQFIVMNKGTNTKIEWKDVTNCYPKAARKVAKPLLRLFKKYRD